jgi:CRP-like cAMP-binding protein
MEARNALAEVSVFKDVLDVQQLDTLCSSCNVRTLPADTVFIHQGGTETSMFVILEGAAQVSISAAGGETRDVTVLVDGDIVGEMSLMTGAPRTATVTSLTAMRLLEVTKESIEILLKATPGLLATFGHLLAKRQSNLSEIANATQLRVLAEPDIIARMQQFFSRVFG